MPDKRTVLLSALALGLATLALPASAAYAAPSPVTAAATTVTRGSFEVAGQPMAGVRTILYAWPANSVLAALKPGQSVPVSIVGTATTDSSGRYAISAAQAGLRAAAAPDGMVNLETVALGAGEFASYSFSRSLSQLASGAVSLPAAAAVKDAKVQSATLANFTRTATAGRAAASRSAAAGPATVPCGWGDIKTYAPAWTVVGASYDTTTSVTQHFTYTVGQSSSIGVGSSTSGTYGSFTVSGSASVSSSASEDFPTTTGASNYRYQTQFRNSEYAYSCSAGFLAYQTRPTSFAGGARSASTTYPSATYCVWQEKGSTFTKNTSSAYTFGAGGFISEVGLNFTAQTGYDNSASLSYHFGIAHYLCGTNAYPGETPKQLVAGKV